jgi:long-chain acyl-CoA synthetase
MNERESMQTIPAFFAQTVANRGDQQALGFIRGGELHWRTWREVFDESSQLAARIAIAGIKPGDRVIQVSENRYEWIITDLALHLAGAVHVPVHVSLSGEQIAAQIVDSGARLVLVSRDELLTKFAALIDPSIPVWCYEHEQNAPPTNTTSPQSPVPSPQSPDSLATILYTSGTTGRPRGVMLSQRNLACNAAATAEAFGPDVNQVRLNILPLSHIYARTCDLYIWVYVGCQLVLAESRETLARDCQLVQPTMLNAVPYVYQKIADRIRAAGDDAAQEAKNLQAFFGGRIETLCCGGAPLAPDVEQWFADRGQPILLGYGLTESSPVISMSIPTARRFRSCGRPIPDIEVRIADDGEVITRGSHVMLGYWQNDAATAEAIRDGWLHTGDLGQLDSNNFLSINGRKKELIVLSTGKKVHPTHVESLLTASPLIEQAAVFGEGRPYLIALIVPAGCGLATHDNSGGTHQQIAAEIPRCLQPAAHEEQISKFIILDRPFSVDRGELTAKLSLCRTVIARNFSQQIADLYDSVSCESNHEGAKATKQTTRA